jgi:hypothetical protein
MITQYSNIMNKVIKILLLSSVFMLGGVYGCNPLKRMAQYVMPMMPMMTCAIQSFSTSNENRSFAKFPGIPQGMTFNQSNPIKCDDSGNLKINGVGDETTECVKVVIVEGMNADAELGSIELPQNILSRIGLLRMVCNYPQKLTLESNSGIIPNGLTRVIEGYLATKIIPDSELHKELAELIKEKTGRNLSPTIEPLDDPFARVYGLDINIKRTYHFQIMRTSQGLVIKVIEVIEHL